MTMEGRTVEAGRTERLMATESVPARRVKVNIRAPGVTALRCWGSTLGPAATLTRAPGRRASAMALAWRARGSGCTKASGPMDLRDGTGSENALETGPSTKAPGAMDYRMATGQRPTRMEVGDALVPSEPGRDAACGYRPLGVCSLPSWSQGCSDARTPWEMRNQPRVAPLCHR